MNEDKYQAKDPVDAAAFAALAAQKDGAYRERNQCVALIAKLAIKLGYNAWLGRHDPADATWDEDWRTIVFVTIPTGQLSWHLHDDDRQEFEEFLSYVDSPKPAFKWDGHTTEEKYRRMRELKIFPLKNQ